MVDAFIKVLDAPDFYFQDNNSNGMLRQMKYAGFIIDDDFDEVQKIHDAYREYKYANKVNLCILPTYKCNLNCWYCVQKHEDKYMPKYIQNSIKELIRNLLAETHRESLTLSWFGGEPLLCPRIIHDISVYAKQLCAENNTAFINSITTNGTLIDDAMIDMFRNIDLRVFQITIDGTRECHNKIKSSSVINDSYEVVCMNIKKLLERVADCDITLRYNYTPQNLSIKVASDLAVAFEEPYRQKLEFLPRPVWQNDSSLIDETMVDEIVVKMKEAGFKVNQAIDLQRPICYAESDYFLAIFYDGKVDKCGNIAPSKAKGRLLENGKIDWSDSLDSLYGSIWTEQSKCMDCKYLPLCMGPCPVRRRRFIEKNEPLGCFMEKTDKFFETMILDYVKSFKN